MKKLLSVTLMAMMVASQPAIASQQPTAPFAFSSDYFVGKWTDNGDCSIVIAFDADGIYTVPGGAKGKWTLSGNQMTLKGSVAPTTFTVLPESQNKVWTFFADGSVGASTRC